MQDKIEHLLSQIQYGDVRSLARCITVVENELDGYESVLLSLKNTHEINVIGITGPPGAGKSTLVNALIKYWVSNNKTVAVLAVDPSSPFNYGALLGDRIRMSEFYNHPNVFIRSIASRGTLGGLNAKILEITDVVKQAGYDYIIVETVGVGQSEVEIAGLADCTVLTLVPEAGDAVQTLKAGIMEIADIYVVNKADRENADLLYRNLKIMVHERSSDINTETPVLKTVAHENKGIEELVSAIESQLLLINRRNGKRAHLLTDKAWQIISANRMSDIKKEVLLEQISENMLTPGFNLYKYTAKFSKNRNNV